MLPASDGAAFFRITWRSCGMRSNASRSGRCPFGARASLQPPWVLRSACSSAKPWVLEEGRTPHPPATPEPSGLRAFRGWTPCRSRYQGTMVVADTPVSALPFVVTLEFGSSLRVFAQACLSDTHLRVGPGPRSHSMCLSGVLAGATVAAPFRTGQDASPRRVLPSAPPSSASPSCAHNAPRGNLRFLSAGSLGISAEQRKL